MKPLQYTVFFFFNSHLPDETYNKGYVSDVTCLEHVKNIDVFLIGCAFLFNLQHTKSQLTKKMDYLFIFCLHFI